MKKLFLLFLLILSIRCESQNIKIILTADSHGLNSWPLAGGYDSIWLNKMGVRFKSSYDTVTIINHTLAGGRTIGSAMPMWYTSPYGFGSAEQPYSIDSVLKMNADLIIISMSGNHTVNHMPADEAIYCFKYLIDTLRSLGKTFIIGGQAPRQKTFTGGMTLQSYYDSCTKINNFLMSYAPKSYVDTRTNLEDTIFGKRPWPAALSSDSLHFSDYGNDLYTEDYMNNFIVDSLLSNFKGRAVDFSFTKVGSNLVLSGSFQYRKITISGSNNYTNYFPVKIIYSNGNIFTSLTDIFVDPAYIWYKIEIFSGKLLNTITKKIN